MSNRQSHLYQRPNQVVNNINIYNGRYGNGGCCGCIVWLVVFIFVLYFIGRFCS